MKPVAEFKFSCPVCHQHIMAGVESAGTEIECPTCYRSIMVPRSPGNATTKLILRGRQASKPHTHLQPTGTNQVAATEMPLLKTAAVVMLIVTTIALTVSGLAKYNDQLQKTGGHTSLSGSIIRAVTR